MLLIGEFLFQKQELFRFNIQLLPINVNYYKLRNINKI